MSTITNTNQCTPAIDEVDWQRELEEWVKCEDARADKHWSEVVSGWFTSNSAKDAAEQKSKEAIRWQAELSKYRDSVTPNSECLPVIIDDSGPLDEDEEPFWTM